MLNKDIVNVLQGACSRVQDAGARLIQGHVCSAATLCREAEERLVYALSRAGVTHQEIDEYVKEMYARRAEKEKEREPMKRALRAKLGVVDAVVGSESLSRGFEDRIEEAKSEEELVSVAFDMGFHFHRVSMLR